MKNPNQEQERLRHLRDRQISQRDPGIKARKLEQHITTRYRSRKAVTMGEWLRGLSHKARGFFIGLLLTLFLWVGLASFFPDAGWVDTAGIVGLVLFPGFGVLVGNGLDIRDRLRDF